MAFNNIIGLTFIISIAVGALFFVAIEYLSGAVWSTPFRRVSEIISSFVVLVPLIVIPLLFNLHSVFHWTHPEVVNADKVLSEKAPYLNINFFVIRIAAFIAIWMLFQYLITRNSLRQDSTKDQTLTTKNVKLSAVFIPFFALTISFTGIDWLMSLEPHWFSTIFGIYYFSGTVLAALATITYVAVTLNENGYLVKGLTTDHYYSMGALLFAFINFWAYIAFSQFLLVWYANLPEETFWFLQRWEGSWIIWTVGLMVVHFLVPYFGLLSQPSKMNPAKLKFFALWILAAHYYDLYFLVMPNYSRSGVALSWYELGFPILLVGLMILLFVSKSKKQNLVPVGDPKLKRGIDFRL
ncbi:MAG: quinol:cytochrome C oxidoreductase [Stygiobacter sp. RIFOXYA12_FULL_38_9]|nr:MAG: quinol:cytochrome C oxidoreductase [Stygiobacter sp. GWC2_38_9]OGU79708.1 MAG: quinol:cytochrome C oxidoreductase [Stygiobacter sp. RIFOXYA12_FULL_38_9]OGV06164.1 MAG: quinol:cytochrome C oxidoreductase [Stygiobacter sp. RIFOXYB2_FULL_37_11]OGV11971.1 MAG: quinol:cytochrome C oxidoreductase [Stygiobacter sp. RIFOXYA2_FULL_38_8]OGV16976.1 MAG: quinol:cytochrome C oxidoreductase [Stygiobacter sp. RIFOXYC2_FULL_38_25]OGV82960.1 MAG: quinol:cytochrome C oxidoreductase [Stygiobacter sp. GWF